MIRYLAFGDSYTIGEGIAPAERWPGQLAARLRGAGWDVGEPWIIAQTGWTTDELAQNVAAAHLTGPFDLVTLLVGVNNQYRGRELDEYRVQFRELLQQSVVFTGNRPGRVVVLSIPDWGVTPFAAGRDRQRIAAEVDSFNRANLAETRDAGAVYVDITSLTRKWGGEAGWLTSDGLHPAGKMYAAWVDLALPAVLTALTAT